ncbi:MAG TPA: hypothetical protein VL282_00810 [Tepidisphaeraceae bacterium]|jgi:hypothetical protein|nr:hypothetical protein [Tepidisphaeraceae bacterium]
MKLLHVPLLVVAMLMASLVFADDEKKSDKKDKQDKQDKIDPQTQKLRDEFGMARLIFLRQATKDAEFEASIRDALVKVCDDSRDDIVAAVDQEKFQPGDDDDRKQAVADIAQKFSDNAASVTKHDRAIEKAISTQIARLTYELELIRKGQLVEKMNDLDLTEEQKAAIEQITADAKKKVKGKSADEVMKDEQAMKTLLDARKKVREKLADDQKDQWKAYVNENATKSSKSQRGELAPKQ